MECSILLNWDLSPHADPAKTLARVDPTEATAEKLGARLRMVEYRRVLTATMVYNDLPICDDFRKVDDDTVMGMKMIL
jgi:hypothetical protein